MRTGNDLIVGGELILSGDVLLDDWVGYMWDEDVFFAPGMVRQALAALGEGRVTVRLNSPGGHADAGEQIRAILAGHPGGCRIVVEGIAASAASLIFMAGAERLMSAGSHLMIHDPSGAIWGNEAEARRHADQLGVVASTYAAVYAAASGKTPDACREIMRAETWFGPEDAIANGFADGIAPEGDAPVLPAAAPMPAHPEPAALASAQSAYKGARQRLQLRISTALPSGQAARPARSPAVANGLQTEDTTMTTPTHTAPQPAPISTPISTPAPTAMAAPGAPDPVAQERTRVRTIREMAAPHVMAGRIAQGDLDTLIDSGVTVADAGARLLATMAAQEPVGRSASPAARIGRDETDTRREGLIGALMGQTEGPATMYRGMRLRHLAMELAGPGRGYDDLDAIRRGMTATTMMGGAYGVSDFSYITTEVMNRSLLAAYNRRAASWQMVTGTAQTATDFRELHAVRFGGDFALKKVRENGEYEEATLSDAAEGLKVERRGRTIRLTFEAVVDDDLGVFNRISTEFAMAARTMESAMVWSLFRANAKLKSDSKALFHTDHGNLAATAAAISIASVADGRKAMWEQRAFGSKDTDDFLQIEPDRLIVPPALEMVALQFTTGTTPNEDGKANPFKSSLSAGVVPNLGAAAGGSDTAWYLVSSDLPPIAHAYLDGHSAPTVQTVEGMNPDAVVMNARHIFGAAAVEYRGAWKNAGV
ncbi:head maturation protease, ClpP-related [Paenirhodobacter enshiensis]|uniref:head maturation protease, ClpP-related n=1 Tax=Paenirhodobacter enshiensis TaxID=1105367 RepID=UPI003FA1E9CC